MVSLIILVWTLLHHLREIQNLEDRFFSYVASIKFRMQNERASQAISYYYLRGETYTSDEEL